MCGGVDGRSGLAVELLDRDPGVGQRAEPFGPRVDVRAHERPVLVERRPPALARMLLERKGNLVAGLDVGREQREAGQAEQAQGAVEVRGAHGHAFRYAIGGSSPLWQPGHQ